MDFYFEIFPKIDENTLSFQYEKKAYTVSKVTFLCVSLGNPKKEMSCNTNCIAE